MIPKCPHCKEEIKHLKAYSEIVDIFEWDDEAGKPYCYGNDYIEGFTSFECPECNEELFTDEAEAITFLKDK